MPVPIRIPIMALAVLAVFSAPVAHAQQQPGGAPGFTRIQGQSSNEPELPPVKLTDSLQDLREDMRGYVQAMATYAHSQKRGFLVIARDALELVIKRDVQDEKKISPAKTFMRSVDAIMQDGVFYGDTVVDQPASKETQPFVLDRLAMVESYGLPVVTMDYARTPRNIDTAYAEAERKKFIPFVAHRPDDQLTEIPPYPSRPFRENPNNILTIRDVKNYLYISDPAAFGRQDEFALRIHDTNYDLIVVDPFSGRDAISKTAVETLKYKKLGARRLVFARIDIATAYSYRYYWRPEWKEGSPSFIAAPFPNDPDRYFVEYWRPEWQQIIFGNENSYLYGIISQGYDGVIVDGLRSFRFFEGGEEALKEFTPLATKAPQ